MSHLKSTGKSCKAVAILLGIVSAFPICAADIKPISVDLHSYGFPSVRPDLPQNSLFYISANRIALFFDQGEAKDSASRAINRRLHQFLVLVISTDGQVLAQQRVDGLPGAFDVVAGPNSGLIFAEEGSMSFYDSSLRLRETLPLPPHVTRVSFDRQWNQLVVASADQTSRSVELLDGTNLKRSRVFAMPIRSVFITGRHQIAFSTGGFCDTSTKIISDERSWDALSFSPLCGMLTFVGDDAFAYTSDEHLFVVGNLGKELMRVPIPPYGTSFPSFSGISDDNSRIAVKEWKRKFIVKANEDPDYEEVFVYDLKSHKRILSRSLPSGATPATLSPDGRQLATIENGILLLNLVP